MAEGECLLSPCCFLLDSFTDRRTCEKNALEAVTEFLILKYIAEQEYVVGRVPSTHSGGPPATNRHQWNLVGIMMGIMLGRLSIETASIECMFL